MLLKILSNKLYIYYLSKGKGYDHCKSIRIWDGNLGDEGVRAFYQFIVDTNKASISLIELLNCNIGPLGCEFISRMFDMSLATKITILNLDYNNFGNEGLYNLMSYIKDAKCLTYLSLGYCNIDENGVKYFNDFLTSSDLMLEKLILQGNPLKNDGAKELIQILRNNTSLEEINLNNTLFGNDVEVIEKLVGLMKGSENIIIYNMKFNFITDQGMLKY